MSQRESEEEDYQCRLLRSIQHHLAAESSVDPTSPFISEGTKKKEREQNQATRKQM